MNPVIINLQIILYFTFERQHYFVHRPLCIANIPYTRSSTSFYIYIDSVLFMNKMSMWYEIEIQIQHKLIYVCKQVYICNIPPACT